MPSAGILEKNNTWNKLFFSSSTLYKYQNLVLKSNGKPRIGLSIVTFLEMSLKESWLRVNDAWNAVRLYPIVPTILGSMESATLSLVE